MRLLVHEDQPIVLDGLGRLAHSLGFTSITAISRVEDIEQGPEPTLAVLDLCYHGAMSGPLLAKSLRSTFSKTKIVFYTSLAEHPYGIAAYQNGYDGWISKRSSLGDVQHALRSVLRGERHFDPRMAEWVDENVDAHLTHRESEIIRLYGQGFAADRDIASRLHISEATVRSHNNKILHKLGLAHKSYLLQYAIARATFL